jgi:hypothetical protein
MPLYTFYPRRADGAAPAFETYELSHDAAALARAQAVLAEHKSAVEVVVWRGEQRIGAVARTPA